MGAIANHKAGHNLLVVLKGVISLSDFGVVFGFGFQLVVGSAKKKKGVFVKSSTGDCQEIQPQQV